MRDGLRILCVAIGLGLLVCGKASAARTYWCDDARGKRVQQSAFADCSGKHWYVDGAGPVVPLSAAPADPPNSKPQVPAVNRMAERQDLDLLGKYVDEGAHRKARVADLEVVRERLRTLQSRLAALAAERKRLDEEAEFYKGKPLPPALQRKFDENAAKVAALHILKTQEEQTAKHIDDRYDIELARLQKLWAGAPAGSLGFLPLPPSPARSPTPTTPRSSKP